MDKLIEPLLAGIYGGDIYKISLLSTFPHFIQVEQKYGNMVKGMMAAKMGHSKACLLYTSFNMLQVLAAPLIAP